MQITLAETAGFCFGVDRAINLVYSLVNSGEKVCTLGQIIHNKQVVDDLESRGVKTIESIDDAPDGYKIVIRTHGISKEIIDELEKKGIPYCNATCPFVLKIHKIVSSYDENTTVLIAGDANHPEVIGIKSYCKGEAFVFKNDKELLELAKNENLSEKSSLICVSQTTFSTKEWKKCQKIIKKVCTNCKIFDTICNATSERQLEATELSENSDAMVVIGGRHSSNTCKLKDVSAVNCDTFLIETAAELKNIDFSNYSKVGVTAGASTPSGIIKEVLKTMSEVKNEKEVETTSALTEEVVETAETADKAETAAVEASADGEASFEELLNASYAKEDNSKVVKGTVVRITPTEVFVDVPGRKQTGVISIDDLSAEPVDKCEDVVSVGDELDLVIMKTNDEEGVQRLSKKLFDSVKGWEEIVAAAEADEVLEGVVVRVIKGGVVAAAKGSQIFIPASLTGVSRNDSLDILKGTTVKFKIVDLNKDRRRAVGSIKVVLNAERKEAEEKVWASIEEGQKIQGVVKSLTSYGAFVDIGGVDGMIHISELSWNRIKHPSEVVNVGDSVEVTIKSLDRENKKISLGFKKVEDNPWEIIKRDYPVDSVVKAKIVNFASFGAFANIIPGVDGLIHISQIANTHIKTPSDVLEIGQEVEAKITEIDFDKKRISLSIRALLPEEEQAPAEEETAAEETAEEETASEEAPAAEETAE